MPREDNLKLEGRLNALRDIVLALLEAEVERGQESAILSKIEQLLDAPDHQEDPGAVNVEAIAVQNAAYREIENILEAVRERVRT
ncbi:hypothetical protein [Limoniibacter endophyticus]|uniref:Uncharacterized protein n=1 Tax=Limoniibacter endophyticus TaxID=1565040 RepID=A0A8J3DQB1_9HYPH|nr:hypothetical protein [Limoniibacter endophyticus]GHC66016.1 hypothetical protein GCM10010136_09130 [Limoniibacter endophyticus]